MSERNTQTNEFKSSFKSPEEAISIADYELPYDINPDAINPTHREATETISQIQEARERVDAAYSQEQANSMETTAEAPETEQSISDLEITSSPDNVIYVDFAPEVKKGELIERSENKNRTKYSLNREIKNIKSIDQTTKTLSETVGQILESIPVVKGLFSSQEQNQAA